MVRPSDVSMDNVVVVQEEEVEEDEENIFSVPSVSYYRKDVQNSYI